MVSINIREFSHNLSKYLNKIKSGERITILERNKPIADVIPHNTNVSEPGWRRDIERVSLKKGKSVSGVLIKMRKEERA